VINRGGGEETNEGAGRPPGVLAEDRPNIVLIMEGTNDARKCWSAYEVVQNRRAMVRAARAANAVPLLATVPPSFSSRGCTHQVIAYINGQIRANREGAILVEMCDVMNNPALFGRDHLHPNERGYAVMAEIWLQAIQQATGAGTAVAQRRQP
jgi:lysophospholipase L1-like esterase